VHEGDEGRPIVAARGCHCAQPFALAALVIWYLARTVNVVYTVVIDA